MLNGARTSRSAHELDADLGVRAPHERHAPSKDDLPPFPPFPPSVSRFDQCRIDQPAVGGPASASIGQVGLDVAEIVQTLQYVLRFVGGSAAAEHVAANVLAHHSLGLRVE